MSDISEAAMQAHARLRGKLGTYLKDTLDSREKLSLYYTPGVAAVSRHLAEHPEATRDYTWTNNAVAIVSDGSAVLGLGDIGPYGALPVMEGKSMLFKHYAGIDAVPIVLNVHTADEIVAAIAAIAPTFGGINLEDIAAPLCFEVEDRLADSLPIPVFHDDQHGTAIVTLAGLINALKVKRFNLAHCKIVISGAGAAGVAIAKLLHKYGAQYIIAVDSNGAVSHRRTDLNDSKKRLLQYINGDAEGPLEEVIKGAHVFIGVSRPGLLTGEMIATMAADPIIFALANPEPEIYPDEARAAGALVVATGRSDFPNQVNNALAFPGIFRGALDNNVRQVTDEHKIAVAEALAGLVASPTPDEIIPHLSDERLVPTIAKLIRPT